MTTPPRTLEQWDIPSQKIEKLLMEGEVGTHQDIITHICKKKRLKPCRIRVSPTPANCF
ncbi:MAG: hypothetical protein MI862_21325 [Desulfobacterales bacterium]|nr:hypothetical protein [Desulfobacterales bacterium]